MESRSKFIDVILLFAHDRIRATAIERDLAARFDLDLWRELGQLGFFKSMLAGSEGGQELAWTDFVAMLERFSEAALDLPFVFAAGVQALPGAAGLSRFGTPEQIRTHLPGVASGETIIALANSEIGAGTDLGLLQSSASLTGDRGALRARKSYATNLPNADLVFLSAWIRRPEDLRPQLEVFLLDGKRGERREIPFAGFRTGATGSIEFKNSAIRYPLDRFGSDRQGTAILQFHFDMERLMVPVILSGMLKAFVTRALEHAQRKDAQGRTLSDNQYVQQKVLRIYRAREVIRGLVRSSVATAKTDAKFPVPTFDQALLSTLKAESVDLANDAAQAMLELWSAAGYREDHWAQKFARDVIGLKSLGGTREQHAIHAFRRLVETLPDATESSEADSETPAA